MQKSLLLGGLLGGLVLFFWGAFSYMVLPWHTMALEKFTDEAVVAQALTATASRSGMYILPNPHKHAPGMTAAQQQAAEEGAQARMLSGPFMFASVSLGGTRDMGQALLLNVLSDILAAALATWLLLQTANLRYGRRVGFVVVMALTTGVITHVPYWIWWKFSTSFTLVEFADLVIGWGLAGLAIAKVGGPSKA
ncbi:MAG: hypothetical protein FJ245_02280 [Nitrospira sp.]|nr:hypothetical protein [Nitrospira sp.]